MAYPIIKRILRFSVVPTQVSSSSCPGRILLLPPDNGGEGESHPQFPENWLNRSRLLRRPPEQGSQQLLGFYFFLPSSLSTFSASS